MSYFHRKYNRLSSALRRFTVLFGMGRSGTAPLWSPGKALEFFANETKRVAIAWDSRVLTDNLSKVIKLHGYRIKLHEQLVLVSSTPHSAYTPNLSTSWSRTTL